MKLCLGLFLLLCGGVLPLGSGLHCYSCSGGSGPCETSVECQSADACLSLDGAGGKTIRQCIRYTDCDSSRLSQKFPAISSFQHTCCNSNLCNSGNSFTTATPVVILVGLVLSAGWCWI